MRPDFKFRTGKHSGRTYEWVEDNDPSYIDWVLENRPEMLKEESKKPEAKKMVVKDLKEEETPLGLKRNDDFYNECPSEMSIPYMLQFPERYQEQLTRFEKENRKEFRLIKEKIEKNNKS